MGECVRDDYNAPLPNKMKNSNSDSHSGPLSHSISFLFSLSNSISLFLLLSLIQFFSLFHFLSLSSFLSYTLSITDTSIGSSYSTQTNITTLFLTIFNTRLQTHRHRYSQTKVCAQTDIGIARHRYVYSQALVYPGIDIGLDRFRYSQAQVQTYSQAQVLQTHSTSLSSEYIWDEYKETFLDKFFCYYSLCLIFVLSSLPML